MDRSPLLLVSAGGLGREVTEAVRAGDQDYVLGYLDDDPTRWGSQIDGVPVLGGLSVAADRPDAQLVLCAGDGSARADLAHRLGAQQHRYATVVHPSVWVPSSCQVGVGSVLLAGTVLTAAVRVGQHVVCMPHVVLTHDDVLDDHATLGAGVALGGRVHVGGAAFLGMACSVRQDVSIGRAAVVGMGSVVLRDVPAGQVWAGVPARPLRRRVRAPAPELVRRAAAGQA